VGIISFVVAAWAMWRKKTPKLQVWLMFIAGLCATGLVASVGGWIVRTVGGLFGKGASVLFGVGALAAGIAMAIVVILELVHAGHPKKGQPGKIHPPLAFLAPGFIAAGGGFFAALANGGHDMVGRLGELTASLF
jgi:hypothetical protein